MEQIGPVKECESQQPILTDRWPQVETYGNLVAPKEYFGRNKMVDEPQYTNQGKQASLAVTTGKAFVNTKTLGNIKF
jgi:hypothetical protein